MFYMNYFFADCTFKQCSCPHCCSKMSYIKHQAIKSRFSTPTDRWSSASVLRSPRRYRCPVRWSKTGNSSPAGLILYLRGSTVSRVGVQASTARPCSSCRAHAARASLVAGRIPLGRPGSGARGHRPSPPGSSPLPSTGGRHEKSDYDARARGGHRTGGCGPTTWRWGESTTVSPEGGPGATRAGVHPATPKQAGGPLPVGWAHANGAANTSSAGRLHRASWPSRWGPWSGGKG